MLFYFGEHGPGTACRRADAAPAGESGRDEKGHKKMLPMQTHLRRGIESKISPPIFIGGLRLFWWRRGESNSRPKTLPQELLRAQTVILGVLLSQFPFLPASRHADGSGELHRSWPVQSFAGARAPRNDACSRAVVLPGQTTAI